jgi:hypothetical protein
MVAGVTGALLDCFCALPATVTGDAGLASGRIAVSSQRRLTTEKGAREGLINAVFCASPGVRTAVDCERAVLGFGESTNDFWK